MGKNFIDKKDMIIVKISKQKLIYTTIDIIMLLSIFIINYYNLKCDELINIKIVSSLICVFVIWSIITLLNIEKDIFTLNMFLIICNVVFIFSPAILYTLGEKDIFIKYKYYVGYKFIYEGLLISFIFFIFLHMTMIMTSCKNIIKPCRNDNSKIFRVVGFIIILISIIPYANDCIKMIRLTSLGSYIDAYSIARNPIGTFIMSGIIIYLAGCKEKKHITISSILLCIYVIPLLYIGRRGEAFSGVISYMFLYDRMFKKVSRRNIVILGLIAFIIIMPTISIIRQVETKNLSTFIDTFKNIDNPLNQILKETGFSFMITPYLLSLVNEYSYHYGLDYVFSLLSSIPNLVYKFDYFIKNGEPASWITRIIDYNEWYKGGGVGFNYIAEAYLNFGIIGIVVIPIIIVTLIKYINKHNYIENRIIAAMFISYIPMFVRGTSYNLIRPILWYAIIPIICCNILISINKKTSNLNRYYN